MTPARPAPKDSASTAGRAVAATAARVSAPALSATGQSAWNCLNAKTRQHAHKLRQALDGAVELHQGGRWGRAEIEAAGMRDYAAVFGHAISGRHFWRIFERVIERAGAEADFNNLAHYLPGRLVRKRPVVAFEQFAKDMPGLLSAVRSVKNAVSPTSSELLFVWDSALGSFQQLMDLGASDVSARRKVIAALDASGLPLSLTREALAKSFSRKLGSWVANGRVPSAIRDGRKSNAGRPRQYQPTEEDLELLRAHTIAKGTLRRAWREAFSEGLLSPGLSAAILSNPSSKSYVPASIVTAVMPDANRLKLHHRAPREAARNGAFIPRDWSTSRPGEEYGADDATLPIYYWEEDSAGLHVLRGQWLAMLDNRSQRILAFALHSERNYTATVIRGLILRTHDSYGLPERFHLENGIWRSSKIIKGVSASGEAIPPEETELGLREFVEFRHAKPGNPRAKPVERVIGLMQDLMHDQPGYCGRNEMSEKWERVAKAKLAVERGEHPSKFFLHREEWIERLTRLCELYNDERQDGKHCGGRSPRETWEQEFDYSRPLVKLTPATRYLLANHRTRLKVTRNGLAVRLGGRTYWFRSEETAGLIGRVVQCFFDPENMGSCFVKLASTNVEALVVPLVPEIPATTASREQLAEAAASVQSHNRALRTRYVALATRFPKSAPSPFRPVLFDPETVESGAQIETEQAAIRERQSAQFRADRRLARDRNRLGIRDRVGAIPNERMGAGINLIKEGLE